MYSFEELAVYQRAGLNLCDLELVDYKLPKQHGSKSNVISNVDYFTAGDRCYIGFQLSTSSKANDGRF